MTGKASFGSFQFSKCAGPIVCKEWKNKPPGEGFLHRNLICTHHTAWTMYKFPTKSGSTVYYCTHRKQVGGIQMVHLLGMERRGFLFLLFAQHFFSAISEFFFLFSKLFGGANMGACPDYKQDMR